MILLDLMMPQMNGWQFLEAQRADLRLASLPVLVLSADATPLGAETSGQVRGRLAKPFQISELLEMIERCAT